MKDVAKNIKTLRDKLEKFIAGYTKSQISQITMKTIEVNTSGKLQFLVKQHNKNIILK
jgi:hypothetical protein